MRGAGAGDRDAGTDSKIVMTDQEKLVLLAGQSERKAELAAELPTLKERWNIVRDQVKSREQSLARETAEVEQLDDKTLSNLLYKVTGRMDQKRAAEEADVEAVKGYCEEARSEFEELSVRVAEMDAELRSLGNCDKDFEVLLEDMTRQALREGGALGRAVTEITARIQKNSAEAAALEELATLGKRLMRKTDEISDVLQRAWKEGHRHVRGLSGLSSEVVDTIVRRSQISDVLRSAEAQVPVLVELARAFQTDIIDLPPVGQLRILQNTFRGDHGESSVNQLELAMSEMESIRRTVERSVDKIERIQPLRADAADRAKRELIETLAQIQR